ncbi:hypothetical protein FB45DRAFT_871452 [Roridomyces roridus]|uniref:Uncharacterized protein n=1 Tax=Roridomyces roridus TaxID=1738132 RepID=A0AAD7BGR6_9AGAR|nr:hypothetical protein FB45DRAFT_871452 [Roridomyces roridus]
MVHRFSAGAPWTLRARVEDVQEVNGVNGVSDAHSQTMTVRRYTMFPTPSTKPTCTKGSYTDYMCRRPVFASTPVLSRHQPLETHDDEEALVEETLKCLTACVFILTNLPVLSSHKLCIRVFPEGANDPDDNDSGGEDDDHPTTSKALRAAHISAQNARVQQPTPIFVKRLKPPMETRYFVSSNQGIYNVYFRLTHRHRPTEEPNALLVVGSYELLEATYSARVQVGADKALVT